MPVKTVSHELTSGQLVFATTCSVWNGLVGAIKSIPEGIKLLTAIGMPGGNKEWNALKAAVVQKCNNPDGSMCVTGFLSVVWTGIKSMHDPSRPCVMAYAIGNDIFTVLSIYFSAGTSSAGTVAGRIGQFMNVAGKLDVVGNIIGKALGISIQVVMEAGGKYVVTFAAGAAKQALQYVVEGAQRTIRIIDVATQVTKQLDWSLARELTLMDGSRVTVMLSPAEHVLNAITKVKEILKDADGQVLQDANGNKLAIVADESDHEALAVVKDGSENISNANWKSFANISKLPAEVLLKVEKSGWAKDVLTTLDADLADATLLAKISEKSELLESWKRLDDAGLTALRKDPIQLEKFDDIVKNNNLGLDANGLGDLLKSPQEKGLAWDNPDKVLNAVKRSSDANIRGLSISHKKFPAPANGTDNFVLKNAKQYQAEASGDAGLSFDIGGVSFDNVTEDGKLIDRKYGHGVSIFDKVDNGFEIIYQVTNQDRARSLLEQAKRQINSVIDGSKIRWEVSTQDGANGIKQLFSDPNRLTEFPDVNKIEVIYKAQINIIP